METSSKDFWRFQTVWGPFIPYEINFIVRSLNLRNTLYHWFLECHPWCQLSIQESWCLLCGLVPSLMSPKDHPSLAGMKPPLSQASKRRTLYSEQNICNMRLFAKMLDLWTLKASMIFSYSFKRKEGEVFFNSICTRKYASTFKMVYSMIKKLEKRSSNSLNLPWVRRKVDRFSSK